jgi:Leucine-rich repeat (LRR) protein
MTTDIDIETYVNSLSNDILSLNLNVSFYYYKCLTSLPDVTRFKNLQFINCSHNELTSLPDLTIFKNLEILNCYNNKLTSLPSLPQNIKTINCAYNKLTSLPDLTGFKNLTTLYCENNQLTSLPSLPQNVEGLYCSCNELTYFPNLPQNLKTLHCSNNHIYKIVGSNNFFQIKQNIQIFNNFRHLYYCLKFKKKLREWLWEKVREPKIIKIYNPIYLVENLNEEDDLDIVLNNWK